MPHTRHPARTARRATDGAAMTGEASRHPKTHGNTAMPPGSSRTHTPSPACRLACRSSLGQRGPTAVTQAPRSTCTAGNPRTATRNLPRLPELI